MKLNSERLWLLQRWKHGHWDMCNLDAKKWQAHTQAPIKGGYLEVSEYGMSRLTDAGREALAADGAK